MSDKFLMILNADWALGYDRLQWILMRRRTKLGKNGEIVWRNQKYFATKVGLLYWLTCLKIETTPSVKAALAEFPDYHKEWYAARHGNIAHGDAEKPDAQTPTQNAKPPQPAENAKQEISA